MKNILNKIALLLFDCIALKKGYRFRKVVTEQQQMEANSIYGEGFSFPAHLEDDIKKYKAGTLNFIAYYKSTPVGTIRLADPKVINRTYEHLGIDKDGEHNEIQSLIVKKEFREGAQFVMLGLVKKVYAYSVRNAICTWSACCKHTVYLTMRRYCKNTQVVPVDFQAINHPVTQHLYANKIIETYFTMEVASFVPWDIFRRFVRKKIRKAVFA
jgi:hypothetical protein